MSEFLHTLKTVLMQDPRLKSHDGELLRNYAWELAAKGDKALLQCLLGNEETRRHFFNDVDGIMVFDSTRFGWVVNNRMFLPDSYTRFANKIGLIDDDGKFIANTNNVQLAFPYKDGVLEGGQTKDDQKRQEIFWNELLSPDEIDRLLAPKVLCHAKVFGKSEPPADHCPLTANLLIKGNNLIALACLEKVYREKVKLIYIDPPYNTGNDSFQYNDRFNHAAWLTFIKNRLSIAKNLLCHDGAIFVQCDDNEQAYLKVLMDEIFGRENFKATFIWHHRKSSQNDIDVSLSHNYTICFAKNAEQCRFNPLAITDEKFANPDNDPKGDWVADPMDAPGIRENLSYKIINPQTQEVFLPPAGRHWRFTKEKYTKAMKENRIVFGKNGHTKPQYKRYKFEAKEKGTNPFTVWSDVDTATHATQELMKLFDGAKIFTTPKPERLLERIITLSTQPGDLVLDFFAGSGTTLAAAHKMGRQWIGVEQMDYIETVTVRRLEKVLAGEQGGISKQVNWQGGGSFLYCELKALNGAMLDRIRRTKTDAELVMLWEQIQKDGYYAAQVDLRRYEQSDFAALSLNDKQRFLMEVLDKNLLYVNRKQMHDAEFHVSGEEKELTRWFYGESVE